MGEVIQFPGRASGRVTGGDGFVGKATIAAHLSVTVRTVERWQHRGLPFYRVGGRNVYRRSEVDLWVAQHGAT